MSFTIIISAPSCSRTTSDALVFCQEASRLNLVHMIFLLGSGAEIAAVNSDNKPWEALAKKVKIFCCVNSARKLHLTDQSGNALENFHPAFSLSGLTTLALGSKQSQKTITFGQRSTHSVCQDNNAPPVSSRT